MTDRLSRLLNEAVDRKSFEIGKDYTSYRLAQESHTTQSYAYRALHGKIVPGREILLKWCNALGCSVEERTKIFHSAGYLSPEELEREEKDEPAA